jgi:dihydrolipoamide dehydrogenase
MISEAALAIEMGAFLDDLAQTIHPHPTMSEGLLESVDAALGEAIHVINKKG